MKARHHYWIPISLLLVGIVSGQQASLIEIQGEATAAGYLAKPASGSNLPAVLLVPESSALTGPVLQTARDMAAHGLVALVVDYDPDHVSRESDLVQSVMDEQISLRLSSGAEWLARQRPLVDPERIGAIGWGSRAARVRKLLQEGKIRAGVVVEGKACTGPAEGAPILVIGGDCDFTQVQEFLKKPAVPKTAVSSSSSAATIRDIMRVINSDDGVRGALARMLSASPNTEVPWDQARSRAAVMVDSSDWLLPQRPPRGSETGWRAHVADYKAATLTLLRAVEQHDLPAAQQALARLPQACGSCHLDHR